MRKFVLFGTGHIADRTVRYMSQIGMEFICFVDNDKSKWGFKDGKPVLNPNEVLKLDCDVIVVNSNYTDIVTQLRSLGFANDIYNFDVVFEYIVEEIINEIDISDYERTTKSSRSFIVENISPGAWGGSEEWAINLANGLNDASGLDCYILCSSEQGDRLKKIRCKAWRCENAASDIKKAIKKCTEFLIDKVPYTIICSRLDVAYYSSIILRRIFPNAIKIINAQHSSNIGAYHSEKICKNVDLTVATSNKIFEVLSLTEHLSPQKIIVRPNAIMIDNDAIEFNKSYSEGDQPIRIAFAARLEKFQKRADLLPNIIDYLESKNTNYVLNIAGDGTYYSILSDYVYKNNLLHKVTFHGMFSSDRLKEYWKNQDIYLNISDFEGMSLAMIESMLYGTVPVVTDVSGVSDVIKHNYNGKISPVKNVQDIAQNIVYLANHRELLSVMGLRSKQKILEKCNYNDYVDFIIETIERLWS